MDIVAPLIFALAQLAVVAGIIYAIFMWRRRGRTSADDPDPGLGGLKRLYFYGISFAALMTLIAGVSLVVQSILDTLFGGSAFSLSSNLLAWGLSLSIVALPIWIFHWRFLLRNVAAMPVERRSIIRKLYLYLALGVSLGFLIAVSYEIIKWAMRAGEFPEFSLASVIPWALVWGYHWRMESAEGQPSVETRGIRRFYLYGASLVGGGMFAVGAGAIADTLLRDGYAALFLELEKLPDQAGFARESLRTDLAVAVAGGAAYWAHWLVFARDDRDSALRWIALFLASVGGAAAALGSAGVMAYTALSWLIGAADESVASHFEDIPGALVVCAVGLIAWGVFRRRMLAEAVGEYATPIRRIYDHLMAALGLIALASAAVIASNTALLTLVESFSAAPEDPDAWREPVAVILALLIVGVPVWSLFWRRLRLAYAADPSDESAALSHRAYIFAALGVGALAFLGGGGGTLFVFLRDLLDAELSLNTARDLAPAVGFALTAALFLPYHWAIYRADQTYQRAESVPEPPPVQKRVTILTADVGSPLTETMEDALGYPIHEARWADSQAFTPTLDDEEAARIADQISRSSGSSVLLIPEPDGGLRLISYD